MTRRRRTFVVATIASLTALVDSLLLHPGHAFAAERAQPWDFDGDGRADLVVAAPALDRGSIPEAGGIVVVPSSDNLYVDRKKLITQSTSSVAGGSEAFDEFGRALASADFDQDGYADLAVGIPSEDFNGRAGAGAVTVLYGTSRGLSGARSRQFSEPSGKEQGARFGTALAAGDLSGDGYPDLAVGAPGDDRDEQAESEQPATGTVTTLLGGPTGLSTAGSALLHGVRSAYVSDYLFGSALVIGDVDGVGPADVVVLSRGLEDNDDGDAYFGSVSLCRGQREGPGSCERLMFGSNLQNNRAVLVGNVQGNSRLEIVVGVPSTIFLGPGHLEILTISGTGQQLSARSTSRGLADLGLSRRGHPAEGHGFGWSLAAGRVDGDRYDDLVVGSPWESVGEESAGRAYLVRGGPGGLAASGNVAYDQDEAGVPGGSETGDRFGSSVALVDRDGDRRLDLTVGASGENDEQGRATTLRGTSSGFTSSGSWAFDLRSMGVGGDRFEAAFGAVAGG